MAMFRHLDLAFWRAHNHLGSQLSSFTRKSKSSLLDASQN
jgi:hypothetical protein